MVKIYLEALNFEVKAIETFLGYKFEGSTVEEKQGFVKKYSEERVLVTNKIMVDSYEEYAKENNL